MNATVFTGYEKSVSELEEDVHGGNLIGHATYYADLEGKVVEEKSGRYMCTWFKVPRNGTY